MRYQAALRPDALRLVLNHNNIPYGDRSAIFQGNFLQTLNLENLNLGTLENLEHLDCLH